MYDVEANFHSSLPTASSDFILLTSNLTFGPSDARGPVTIIIINDGYAEFTEKVSFELVSYEDNIRVLDGNTTLHLTITDQTGALYMYHRPFSYTAIIMPHIDFLLGFEVTEMILHENETLELGIAVLAGAGTEIPFTVTYSTASGTAQGTS